MTPAQIRAARFLVGRAFATPADIGVAISTGRTKRPGGMTEQGAGRLGGKVASGMVKDGLAENVNHLRQGFPAYRLSNAGYKALIEIEAAKPGRKGKLPFAVPWRDDYELTVPGDDDLLREFEKLDRSIGLAEGETR